MTQASQFLVFDVDGRAFALPLDAVAEVLRMVALTPCPHARPWIAGLLNLRGHALPVVDLRTRLNLPSIPPTLSTPIVVVAQADHWFGLIADEMIGVIDLGPEAMSPVAEDERTGAHLVAAIARGGKRLITILDPARLYTAESVG